ncbi:MAG: lysylphosphatidylglycerol synthase transmembrane domain-containing protein [Planctomycetota bacterium]
MSRAGVINLIKIAIAIGLIFWVLDRAGGWANVRGTLTEMQPSGWVLGTLAITGSTCLSIIRWHMLMRSVGLVNTAWAVFKLGWIGVFFNNVVPGLTGGDLIKAFYVTRDHPNQRTDAVISVIVDRVIGIVALALIAAVIVPFDLGRYGQVAAGIYGFLGATALGSVVVLSRRVKNLLRRLLGRPDEGGGTSLLAKIDRAVSMYRNRLGTIALAMAMSIVVHLLLIVGMRFFGGALAGGALAANDAMAAAKQAQMETLLSLGLDVYCSIIPIIFIISSLPIAPAGWGVGEVAFQHFFQQVGVGVAAATALSLTYRLTAMLISLIGGVFLALDRKRVVEEAGPPPVP